MPTHVAFASVCPMHRSFEVLGSLSSHSSPIARMLWHTNIDAGVSPVHSDELSASTLTRAPVEYLEISIQRTVRVKFGHDNGIPQRAGHCGKGTASHM